jgi:hypothetical protein
LIGLALELPLLRLGFDQRPDKQPAICRRMNKSDLIQRAMKRCSREKWLVKSQQDKADAIATSPNTLSANVRKGADVLADVLATRKGETKLHLSKYALEASQEAAEHPQKLKITRQAKEIAQTAKEVWAEESEDGTQPFINVAILNL